MRYLVTGGAGFIGGHVAEALVAEGHQVVVIDNLSTGNRDNVPAEAELVVADIASPEGEALVAEARPDGILHFAAQMAVPVSLEDPGFDARTNVEGTVRVANAAVTAGCEVVIFASSGGCIYGEQETFPAPETHPCRSESPYGTAKRCGEIYLDFFARHAGLRTVSLRLANVYGPRQNPKGEAGVVAIFAGAMLEGRAPLINGDGRQTRDYVFVDDVVGACLLALRNPEARGALNIGTGIETDVNELAALIARATGFDGELPHGPAKPGEQRRSVVDTQLAQRILGWTPGTSFPDGIATTVGWFREQP